jgi:tetratricopeptide (TPR) repeat protein
MNSRKTVLIHILAIVLLTGAFYAPSLSNGFIWDDDDYILNNFAIQSPAGLGDIWFSYKTPQYYPVVFTSFWIEYHLWGLHPFGYHLVNLVFHILNALLLYAVVKRLRPSLAFAAALIFAVHPVQVETVAWITERKNIYGAFFYLLAIYYYVRWFESKRRLDYGGALISFILALLSKSITVTFVAVPLLIRWWQGHKLRISDGLRLLPFALLGLLAGLNTVYLELFRVGAQGSGFRLPFFSHLVLAGKIVVFYVQKLLFPFELVFIYPRWSIDTSQPAQWLPVIGVVAILALLYANRNRLGKGPFAGFASFVIALFPALGFFNVYPMIYSYVADHFQYIASISLIVLLCGVGQWVFEQLSGIFSVSNPKTRALALLSTLTVVCAVAGSLIPNYLKAYENTETLWLDVLSKNPKAWIAHNNLGLVYLLRGQNEKAMAEFKKTLEIKPDDDVAHGNIGHIYMDKGLWDEAQSEYEIALRANPESSTDYTNLGLIHIHKGEWDQARQCFEKSIALDPLAHAAHLNLGLLHLQDQEIAQAIEQYKQAIAIHPLYSEAYLQLGLAYAQANEADPARKAFEKVLEIDPQHVHAHNNLGILDRQANRLSQAEQEFRKALEIDSDFLQARFGLGEVLLAQGKENEAREHLAMVADKGIKLPAEIEEFLRASEP